MFDYFGTHTLKGWGGMSPLKSLPRFIGDLYGLYPEESGKDVTPEDLESEIAEMKRMMKEKQNG